MDQFHLSERFNVAVNRIGLSGLLCSMVVGDAMRHQSACQIFQAWQALLSRSCVIGLRTQ